MNESDKDVWDQEVNDVPLKMQGHTMNINFHVMHMTRVDLVLGHEWLHSKGSSLQRSYQSITLALEDNGVHVLLLGEQDIPPLPLISSIELNFLVKNNEVD